MSAHDTSAWRHVHDYGTSGERHAERRTRWVVALTLAAMLVEAVAGWITGSMALIADAGHMASHVGALALAAFAYGFARRHACDARFTFGTGKVSALAGYTSAVLLCVVAAWMAWESVARMLDPVPIRYVEAMSVAVLGLAVNLASAWLLGHDEDAHDHAGHPEAHEHAGHPDAHEHSHDHEHVDHNLKAAYVHVLADSLTSLLAIVALTGGMLNGWSFLDPLMGLVGAAVVARWGYGLVRSSAAVLLDAEDHSAVATEIRRVIEAQPDHDLADLHLWRVGPESRACIVSLVTHSPRPAEHYRTLLHDIATLDHVTVEINQCRDARCATSRLA